MAAETQTIPSQIDGFPYVFQYDPSIADSPYSITNDPEQTFGKTGCVPSAEAMLDSYFRGVEISPLMLAEWNLMNGFRTPNAGTDSRRSIPAFAREFGYHLEQPKLTPKSFLRAIGAGGIIFSIVRHPDRDNTLGTPGGHAILVRAMEDTGAIRVSTSSSIEKSLKPWHVDDVLNIADQNRTFAIFPKSHTR